MQASQTVGFEIHVLSNLICRRLYRSRATDEEETLTGINGWVIGYLAHREGEDVFQRDLEEKFSIRRSTVSSVLALMEKKGLIVRSPVAHDARLKKLGLTDRARQIHARAECMHAELEQTLTKDISPQELEAFFSVCRKIRANLEQEQDRKEASV